MSTILVTGGKGFVGKKLVVRLQEDDHEVIAFDIDTADISEKSALSIYFDRKVQHVFHLAAKTFVPDSWKSPYEFYRTNVLGTTSVLEFCRIAKVSLTYVSSYLYGEPEYLPIDEQHPIKAYNPYSHSKILSEQLCEYYRKTFGIVITIFRPFNIFGPGQADWFLIPKIVKQVSSDAFQKIEVNDLRPKRDYVYVDDIIDALVLSLKNISSIFNIGSGFSFSVEEIINITMEVACISKKYQSSGEHRPIEIDNVVADISKARQQLGWTPQTSFKEGIKRCLEYYRTHC